MLRARLVQEHSLAKDKVILERHTAWKLLFTVAENLLTGERSMEMQPDSLLPTEQIESGTARVRPVFLKSDGAHYDAVFDSLLDATASSTELEQAVETIRKKIRAADPDYASGRPKGPWDESSMSNKQLAGAWLYGRLLHEDVMKRTYSAGVSAEEMLTIIDPLYSIERLVVEGSLDLPEKRFTDPVAVTSQEWAPKNVRAFVADIGTPMPANVNDPSATSGKISMMCSGPWHAAARKSLGKTTESV